jgi:hypothetical protein
MNTISQIEDLLNGFLLRDVTFYIEGGKVLKRGKLILFKFKEFHFVFTLKNDKAEHKVYEIPYPFNWYSRGEKRLDFSYSLDDFTLVNSELYYRTKVLDTAACDKLYNNYLVLSAI